MVSGRLACPSLYDIVSTYLTLFPGPSAISPLFHQCLSSINSKFHHPLVSHQSSINYKLYSRIERHGI